MPAEAEAAQEKSYVTYSITSFSAENPPIITISESRNLLGGTGTTGFRTWEASLQMGDFLTSPSCPPDISLESNTILELGCGTGYLAVLCAKYLKTTHITTTDGFDRVVDDLAENLSLNELKISPRIRTRLLKWGKDSFAENCGNDDTFLEGKAPDVILGADVTYDAAALPALCETLEDLLAAYPKTQILIASTVRNEDTFKKFLDLCEEHKFERESLEWEPKMPEAQKGPFYTVDMPVRMSRITARKQA